MLESLVSKLLQLDESILVSAALGLFEVPERDRIEVVVGQRDETEPHPAQLDDLLDDRIGNALARLLPIGAPYGTERAVLGTPAHRLDGGPHVAIRRDEIPSRGQELVALDPATLIEGLGPPIRAVGRDPAPDDVPIALDDRVRAAELVRLLRVEGGVDPSEDDVRPAV